VQRYGGGLNLNVHFQSCHADPCAAGAELEKAVVDWTVHVVGFGLKKSESKALQCLSDATGGQYLFANNAKELSRALKQSHPDERADVPTDTPWCSFRQILSGKRAF
jgi:hypothetical protein